MAKARQIKATLVLNEGNFFTNVKKASSGLKSLNKNFDKNSSSMKKHKSVLDSTGSSLTSLAKKVGGVAAAYVSISSVTNFMKECVSAADVQAAAEKRLETTIMNVKGATLEGVSAIKNYAAELQGVTTVGDEVTIQGASQLATFQLQSDTIKTLLPSLQDLAVAQYGTAVSGDQMQQMANLMGKVMSGNVSSLSRYGVVMNDTQKKILKTGSESQKSAMLVEVLGQNFGGLAQAMANTPAGRVQQLKNAWGDMQEVVGAKLYPIITNVLTYLTDKIPTIQSTIGSVVDNITPILSDVWEGIKQGAKTAGDMLSWVKDNWSWLKNVIMVTAGVIAGIKIIKKIVDITKKIKLAKAVIREAFGITTSLGQKVGGALKTVVKGAGTALKTVGKGVVSAAKFVGKGTVSLAKAAGKGAVGAAKFVGKGTVELAKSAGKGTVSAAKFVGKGAVGALKLAGKGITGVMGLIGKGISAAFVTSPVGWIVLAIVGLIAVGILVYKNWDKISAWFVNMWNKIKDGAVWCWEGIKGAFSAVGEWFGGVFNAAKDAICNAFQSVKDFVKSIWDGVVGIIKGAINSIIKGINSMISGAVKGINLLIDGINKVTGVVGIPEIPHLNAPQIPLLAKGGIIRRGGDVIVGERGPEMLSLPRGAQVTPLPAGAAGGNIYTNTFYVTVNADDDSAAARFVRQVKEILDNM